MLVLTSVNVLAEFPPSPDKCEPLPSGSALLFVASGTNCAYSGGWNASQKVTGTEVVAGSVFSWRSEQREKRRRLARAVLFPEKVLSIFAEQRVVREPFHSTCVEFLFFSSKVGV